MVWLRFLMGGGGGEGMGSQIKTFTFKHTKLLYNLFQMKRLIYMFMGCIITAKDVQLQPPQLPPHRFHLEHAQMFLRLVYHPEM